MIDLFGEPETIRCISLWQPWAQWVLLGWKTIETRRHTRFSGLLGERIAIHAALKWDDTAIDQAFRWLTLEQRIQTIGMREKENGGRVVGTVFVNNIGWLKETDSAAAMIECESPRYGLFLRDQIPLTPFPEKGRQGIWKIALPRCTL